MKAPNTLRPPENWQDFESLCKKLWGEIWKCPEIQKNGRLGQDQCGVDIYGFPEGAEGYYGIQCKGINEYYGGKFGEEEIIQEVEKAKKFMPPLCKYYLTTTAPNDNKIQEFVRVLNLKNRMENLFEVHLFGWETIVDLINENRETYDYYVKSQNYKTERSVRFTFHDNTTEITLKPKFRKVITDHIQKSHYSTNEDGYFPPLKSILQEQVRNQNIASSGMTRVTVNCSFAIMQFCLQNTGNSSIENFKVILEFLGDFKRLDYTNKSGGLTVLTRLHSNIHFHGDSMGCEIIPENHLLVSDDILLSDKIYLQSKPMESKIVINWKLLSKNYKTNGDLFLNIIPDIYELKQAVLIGDKVNEYTIEGEIEDYVLVY